MMRTKQHSCKVCASMRKIPPIQPPAPSAQLHVQDPEPSAETQDCNINFTSFFKKWYKPMVNSVKMPNCKHGTETVVITTGFLNIFH